MKNTQEHWKSLFGTTRVLLSDTSTSLLHCNKNDEPTARFVYLTVLRYVLYAFLPLSSCRCVCVWVCAVSWTRHVSCWVSLFVFTAVSAGRDQGAQVWRLRPDHPESLEEICGPQEVCSDEGRRWVRERLTAGSTVSTCLALPLLSSLSGFIQLPICCWTEKRGGDTASTETS